MPGQFLVQADRPFSHRGIEFRRAPNRLLRGLRAPNDLDQRHQMRRIERVPDDAALGVSAATRLDLAHRETGRTRRDDHLGRQQLVELSVELRLEFDPLGSILLDEIRVFHGPRQLGCEGQLRLGCAGREAQSLERRPRVLDEALQGGLRVRRDIGRRNLEAVGQEQRRPARADDACSDDGGFANGSRNVRHGCFSS